MMPDSAVSVNVTREIERNGYSVVPDFFAAAAVAALADECRDLHARAQLRPAAVGRARGRQIDTALRGDHTVWFDAVALTDAQQRYWSRMDALRRSLNRDLLLGANELEAHYALYPPGARYARHRDRFRDDDARVLSSVLYLNPDWRDSEGGALRLYLHGEASSSHHDIFPRAGTFLLFLSADFDHEVLPATRDRLSIAGWFRR
jgi:SM-20-related protein